MRCRSLFFPGLLTSENFRLPISNFGLWIVAVASMRLVVHSQSFSTCGNFFRLIRFLKFSKSRFFDFCNLQNFDFAEILIFDFGSRDRSAQVTYAKKNLAGHSDSLHVMPPHSCTLLEYTALILWCI
jgi:hypothetical protein